jgi:hypothetical protein
MPLVILHHLLNVSVQLANKRGLKKTKTEVHDSVVTTMKRMALVVLISFCATDSLLVKLKTKLNSVAWVRERTILA